MCTVSIISMEGPGATASGGFRVVCNRDESRRRVGAAPPRWRTLQTGRGRAIWPMDMEGGGTWIGASQRGVSLCLLNLNSQMAAPPSDTEGLLSRGLVIPELLESDSLEGVIGTLGRLPLARFSPFRLVGAVPTAGAPRIVEARWDGSELEVVWHAGPPLCFVSSGLGDNRVLPRLDLFEELVVRPGPTRERQDHFHRHVWPDRSEISVLMSREAARTVSITTLDVIPAGSLPEVAMAYEAIPEREMARTPPARPFPLEPVRFPAGG